MKTLLTSGYVEAVPAPGWHFFHGRVWMFLYLGQDFCAKTPLMNKPVGLPSKPVSFHCHFLQTGKQYFCDSLFVICLFFLCLLLLPSFHSSAMQPLAAGSHMPGSTCRGLSCTEWVSKYKGVIFISLENFLKPFDSYDMKLVTN